MSQAGALGPGNGGSGIITIDGDSGSITGSTVTIYAHNSVNNCGGTVRFANSGTTSTMFLADSSSGNIFLGNDSGNVSAVGTSSKNTSLGNGSLNSLTISNNNTAIGNSALKSMTGALGGGGSNVAIGYNAGSSLTTGTDNILIGTGAGSNYTSTEIDNIILGENAGVTAETNVLRIGVQGTGTGEQNKCFIAGITGATATGSAPIAVNSSSQISSLGFGSSGQVLTSNGSGNSPTWQAGGGGTSVNFSVKISGNIAGVTGDATAYLIAYDTVVFDSASGFNTGTSLYTFPTTGIYQLNASWFVYTSSGTSTSTVFLGYLLFNGSTNVRLSDASPNSLGLTTNSEFMVGGTYLYSATAGDTVGMYVQAGGGTKNIGVAGGAESCLFSGFLIH